ERGPTDRRLARTGFADQSHDLTGGDHQVDVMSGAEGLLPTGSRILDRGIAKLQGRGFREVRLRTRMVEGLGRIDLDAIVGLARLGDLTGFRIEVIRAVGTSLCHGCGTGVRAAQRIAGTVMVGVDVPLLRRPGVQLVRMPE